jgi:hypothetical protein
MLSSGSKQSMPSCSGSAIKSSKSISLITPKSYSIPKKKLSYLPAKKASKPIKVYLKPYKRKIAKWHEELSTPKKFSTPSRKAKTT